MTVGFWWCARPCGGWSPSCHGLGRYTTRHGRTRYPGPNLVRLQTLEEEREGTLSSISLIYLAVFSF